MISIISKGAVDFKNGYTVWSMALETLAQLFWEGIEKFPRPDRFLQPQEGSYEPVSTRDVSLMVRGLAQGLASLGVQQGDRVALISFNRIEWAVTDYAVQSIGAVLVPLYTSLAESQLEFILKDCGARVVIVDDAAQLEKVLKVRDRVGSIRNILSMGEQPAEGVKSFKEVMELGKSLDTQAVRKGLLVIRPDDVATILYTSGTTGMPKGVMLTHRNVISNAIASSQVIQMTPADLMFSMLPLSHVFERILDYCAFMQGACIAYPTKLEEVVQNMQVVRPTVMGAVPRFFEKFYARVMEQVQSAGAVKRAIFRWASGVGRQCIEFRLRDEPLQGGLAFRHAIADFLVFRKIRARTGGRIRFFVSGGAALSKELAEFLVSMGFLVLEGYGLTETSPVITVNPMKRAKLGTVGKPLEGVEVKIAEDGEILVRGPNVMLGYYNRPEETAQAIRDGWLHTGDIGELDAEGYLRITDRKKDLFKTSGGKYVAPAALENQLKMSPYISMAVVVGNNRRFPACLIVPNFERLERYAKEKGLACRDAAELLALKETRDLFEQEIERVNAAYSQPERIKKFALLKKELSIADGELTPTMKVRRGVVEERYRDLLESLYGENA